MLGPLVGTVRADINRQVGWAKDEVRRQRRHVVVVGVLLGLAALAGSGALIVGLIALYLWLTPQYGVFIALGLIGGGLLVLALILVLLAVIRRRPPLAARPPLQVAQPAAVLGILGQSSYGKAASGGEHALRFVTENLRDGSRSTLLGTLALVAVVGLMASRTLRR
jgi:hypothetical protein